MKLLPFATKAEAEARRDALAAELGYPHAGVDVGAGIHAPPEQTRTLYHHAVIEHPDGRAALELPAGDAEAVSKLTAGEIAAQVDLTADWTPDKSAPSVEADPG